jgi:hypothetical protein
VSREPETSGRGAGKVFRFCCAACGERSVDGRAAVLWVTPEGAWARFRCPDCRRIQAAVHIATTRVHGLVADGARIVWLARPDGVPALPAFPVQQRRRTLEGDR